jgi:hypothetical protein
VIAALRRELTEQVTALFAEGHVETPHAYVQVWVGLRRYQQQAGWRPLPGAGGWLDQDAELMWALEECDRVWAEQDAQRKSSEAAQEALVGMTGVASTRVPALPVLPAQRTRPAGKTPLRLTGSFE